MECPSCLQIGRVWPVEPDDVFCGLCGGQLRRVQLSVSGARAPEESEDADQGTADEVWTWIVSSAAGATPLNLEVRSVGRFGTKLQTIEVEPAGRAAVACQPAQLQPGEDPLPAQLRLLQPLTDGFLSLSLIACGDFPKTPVKIRVIAAPRRLIAQEEQDADFGGLEGQGFSKAEVATVRDGRLVYRLGELKLEPWSSGRAVILLRAENQQGLGAIGIAATAYEALEGEPVRVETPAPGHDQCRIILVASDPEHAASGIVRLELAAVNRPVIEIPVRLEPGRTEWTCVEPADPEQDAAGAVFRMPAGYPAVLSVEFQNQGQQVDGFKSFRLRLKPSGNQLTCRVFDGNDSLGEIALMRGLGQAVNLKFRVRLTALAVGNHYVDLDLVAVADAGGAEVPLSIRRRVPVQVTAAHSNGDEARRRHRLVVDFGTTNTCLTLLDPEGIGGQPIYLPRLADQRRSESDADLIPTYLWLSATRDRDDPDVQIGYPAAVGPIRGGAGRLFREFKPEIGGDTTYPVPIAAMAPSRQEYKATDLMKFFLRELLLEVRSTLGNELIDALYVTYPATFTSTQRQAVESILRDVAKWGVIGETEALVDEANAGAFRDLYEFLWHAHRQEELPPQAHAMIFDIGGGTIDVAMIRARRSNGEAQNRIAGGDGAVGDVGLSPGAATALAAAPFAGSAGRGGDLQASFGDSAVATQAAVSSPSTVSSPAEPIVYQLEPIGITGLRDFAGKNITEALARLLEEKLYAKLYGRSDGMNLRNPGCVPLTVAIERQGRALPAIVEAAQKNHRFLLELAELIKEKSYGHNTEELNFEDQDWYDELNNDLVADALPVINDQMIFAKLLKVSAIDPEITLATVSYGEWRAWLGQIEVSRRELDSEIGPGLDEAFGRAKRMWEQITASDATGNTHPRKLDLFLMAGGSSCLPILWRKAQQWLGVSPSQIRHDSHWAKRKVAMGAANYAAARRGVTTLAVMPPMNISEYVLLPIGYRENLQMFSTLYASGTRISPVDGSPVDRQYTLYDTQLDLVVFESVDYRPHFWKPENDPKLKRLGLRAPGKEPLTTYRLQFANPRAAVVRHRIEAPPHAPRKMIVEYQSRNGLERKDQRI